MWWHPPLSALFDHRHISANPQNSRQRQKKTQQCEQLDFEQQAHLSNTRTSFFTLHSTLVMTFALVASEMGAMGALSILSKMFLTALFARHVVLPSALQTLDWTRSTLSFPANKEFTAKIEKKCDQIIERALVNPIKSCARSCKERWLDIMEWTQQRVLQQAASVRYIIEYHLDYCASLSQHRRRLSKKYKTALEALAIHWFYRCIEV
jgi:hypothetical protein